MMPPVCTNGEDKDMRARFTATSVGGKRAVQTLAAGHRRRRSRGPKQAGARWCASNRSIITHKSYGRIYTPVFEIVGLWVGMDTNTVDGDCSSWKPLLMPERRKTVRAVVAQRDRYSGTGTRKREGRKSPLLDRAFRPQRVAEE